MHMDRLSYFVSVAESYLNCPDDHYETHQIIIINIKQFDL